jgi:hypothetical protein
LHPTKRFETANHPNVFVPTNLDVAPSVKKTFGAFYAELFDETLRRSNNNPERNVWGGPPDGRSERFSTAHDLADVPRGRSSSARWSGPPCRRWG